MELKEALDLPFEQYMMFCHAYCRRKAEEDRLFADIFYSMPTTGIEAIWARRYWYYKNGAYAV